MCLIRPNITAFITHYLFVNKFKIKNFLEEEFITHE